MRMRSRSFPLANHLVMSTTDPEFACDRLVSVYGAKGFDVPLKGRGFQVRACHLQVDDVGLSYCDYANETSLVFDEGTFVRQIFNISGSAAYSIGNSGEITEGGCTPVLRSGAPLKFDCGANYRHLVLRIEQVALRRYLSALLGQEVERDLIFGDSTKEHSYVRRARRLVFQFASDFDDLGDSLAPLAASEITRGLIMNFLMCHEHDYSHLLFRAPPTSRLSTTKRVEEFIEANWDRPIDIEQLSAVARVSVRTSSGNSKRIAAILRPSSRDESNSTGLVICSRPAPRAPR